jgi:hypothetical protein
VCTGCHAAYGKVESILSNVVLSLGVPAGMVLLGWGCFVSDQRGPHNDIVSELLNPGFILGMVVLIGSFVLGSVLRPRRWTRSSRHW